MEHRCHCGGGDGVAGGQLHAVPADAASPGEPLGPRVSTVVSYQWAGHRFLKVPSEQVLFLVTLFTS